MNLWKPIAVGVAVFSVVSAVLLSFTPLGRFPRSSLRIGSGPPESWAPTLQAIRESIGVEKSTNPLGPRNVTFAKMFQQRFRENGMAVGMRFLRDGHVKLMIMRAYARREKEAIARRAFEEARTIFLTEYPVDIYDSTGLGNIKVGELRGMGPNTPPRIRFADGYNPPEYARD